MAWCQGPQTPMAAPSHDARLPPAIAGLRAWFERSVPFREDKALAAELADEAGPVLSALLTAHDAAPTAMHEAFALLRLLGRRVGYLGATPTAALALCRALNKALQEVGCSYAARELEQLEMVCLEGYCSGRDDRLRESSARALFGQQLELTLAPGCHALVLSGAPPGDDLERWLDEAMRTLFRAEAKAVIVDATRLDDRDDALQRILGSALLTAASLGVHVSLVADHSQLYHFVAGLLQREQLTRHTHFQDAVARALGVAGHTRRRSWPEALGFGRRRTDH
jgi:hypothetical protein